MVRPMWIKAGIDGLDEIIQGFQRGGLIIVAGAPGTGKTSLAASFIYNGAARYGEPGVYASLIEDGERFHEYMRGFGYDFKPLEERGLFRYIALPTLLRDGLSASINTILESVESMGAKRLVIDSYTAISQMFESQAEARALLHTIMYRIIRQLNCTTILIKEERSAERKEYGFEEFIADAVIELRMGRLDDKLIRELTIIKLRGSEVKLPDACFTLHGGFRVLLPPQRPLGAAGRPRLPEDPPTAYSTGIPDLDAEIGGYPRGSTILVELDPRVGFPEYSLILAPFGASFIEKGRHVLVITSGGVTEHDVREMFRGLYGLPDEVLDERLHVFSGSTREEDPFGRFLEKARSLKPPHAILIGVDRLFRIYGRDRTIEMLEIGIDHIRRCGSAMIWLLKPTEPGLPERLASIAHQHLKITRRHGAILLYGVKPRTPLYAIQRDPTKQVPKIIPIS